MDEFMLRELRTFLAVVKRGTFAAAGQQIGLTQSAVSSQIKNLEEALGMHLFERSARSTTLNAAGQRAVPLAEEILELFARMRTPESLEGYHGELRIGAIGTVQTGILPPTLLQFNKEAPEVDVKLAPGVSLNLLNQVDAGDLDLAILIKPPFALTKEIKIETILREPFVLIAPLDVTIDDPFVLLQNMPFIRYDRSSFGGRLVTQFIKEKNLDVHQSLELDELDAIVKMVQTGLGVSLIPMAGLWLDNRHMVRILPLGEHTFFRELVLISKTGLRQLPIFHLFRECLLRACSWGCAPP